MSTRGSRPLADLRSALDRLTVPPLLTAVAALLLVLLLAVAGRHLLHLEPPSGGRIDVGTGDFLAFWTGAVLLHDGAGASLYDVSAQQHLQAQILGGQSPQFQGYLNPPLLAIALSLLVPLGYLPAFYAYVLACTILLVAGLVMLLRMVPSIRGHRLGAWTLVLVIASYQPMFQTTVGGQNTPITFALLTGLALALQARSSGWAALALGLLTFKPQYAVGAGIALLFAGNWPVLAGGALLGGCHWLVGAWWSGLDWPLDMLAFMRAYRPLELAANADTHFSWVSVVNLLLPTPIASVLVALGALAVLAAWWRFRELGRRGDPAWMALVVCGTMFASPHQQYYDVALLALPVAVLIDHHIALRGSMPSLATRLLLAAAYVGYPLWSCSEWLRFQPLFLVLLGVSGWAIRCCMESANAAALGEFAPQRLHVAASHDAPGGPPALAEDPGDRP